MTFYVYDSETGEEFPEQKRYAVSYMPSWQILLARCEFGNIAEARASVALCDMYLMRSPTEGERQYRVWRVANLFRAVPRSNPTALGIRVIDFEVGHYMPDQALRLLDLQHKVGLPIMWDWADTRKDALNIWQKSPNQLRKNRARLYSRGAAGPKPKRELRHYLAIIDEVMDEYMPLALFEGDNEP